MVQRLKQKLKCIDSKSYVIQKCNGVMTKVCDWIVCEYSSIYFVAASVITMLHDLCNKYTTF